MNERIEKLALECGAWHQVYEPNRFLHDHNFDIKKFAELIVRECAWVADTAEPYQTRDLILEHFGVEP